MALIIYINSIQWKEATPAPTNTNPTLNQGPPMTPLLLKTYKTSIVTSRKSYNKMTDMPISKFIESPKTIRKMLEFSESHSRKVFHSTKVTLKSFSENMAKSKISSWNKPPKIFLKTNCLKSNNQSLMSSTVITFQPFWPFEFSIQWTKKKE